MGFYVGSSTVIKKGTTALSASDIGIYDTIKITYEGSEVDSIEITDDFQVDIPESDKEEFRKVSGEIDDITSNKIEIDGKEYYYANREYVDVEIDGKEEDLEELIDLFEEDDFDYIDAELKLDEDDYVVEIIAEVEEDDSNRDDEDDGEYKGLLNDITSSKIEIGDDTFTLADEDDIDIEVDGDEEDLDYLVDLFDDDDFDSINVEITLEEGEVVEVIADVEGGDSSDEEDNGEVDYLSASRIEIDGEEYDLSDDVDVSVEDGDNTINDIDELVDAFDDSKLFDVTVQIEDDEVVEIEGEVIGIDECELFDVYSDGIRVSCDSGQYKYEVDEDCDIEIDGDSRSDLDDLESAIDDGDVTLELTIDDGVITEIIAEVD